MKKEIDQIIKQIQKTAQQLRSEVHKSKRFESAQKYQIFKAIRMFNESDFKSEAQIIYQLQELLEIVEFQIINTENIKRVINLSNNLERLKGNLVDQISFLRAMETIGWVKER